MFKLTRMVALTLGILVGFTIFSSPTYAQTDPSPQQIEDAYRNDPLRLIARSDETRAYSIRSIRLDRIEVWTCDTPSRMLEPDPDRLVRQLQEARSYFAWLSGGLYVPEFIMGGTVESAEEQNCIDAIGSRSKSRDITGVIVMTDTSLVTSPDSGDDAWGWGGAGNWCIVWTGEPCTWPENDRNAQINSNTTPPSSGGGNLNTHTLIHEMGHMLSFPHSFSGDISVDDPQREYDNPMDFMSDGRTTIGTPAINRYAAGWIPEEQVEVHPVSEGDSRPGTLYELAHLDHSGPQMLVLPVRPGKFYALGTRIRSSYDDDISHEGVEVYLIDQSDCDPSIKLRLHGVCMGILRRTKPVVAAGSSVKDFGHVYVDGEVMMLDDTRGIQVGVLGRTADGSGYRVWVGPGPMEGFFDDEGSVHEESIDKLAEAGITRGCERYLFCPHDKVTRAQMVVLLARALGLTTTPDSRASTASFSDVEPGAWYAGHLNALGSIASGYPDGTFRPRQPITRGEMAIMLNRALPLDANGDRNAVVFADVPAGTELATAVANLAASGITQGCASESEPLFCPDETLSRAQMASFLARSPISLDPSSDDDDDDDDGEVRPDGREVRISVGEPSERCPRNVICSGLHRDYHYEFSDDFGPPPYTLECWVRANGGEWSRKFKGDWRGKPEKGCYAWGESGRQTVYVVVDGVKSNELDWSHSDDEETQPDSREVRIEWGADLSSDPDPAIRAFCLGFVFCSDFSYELSGFGPAPYTLACWISWESVPYKEQRSWAGPEREDKEERCKVKAKRSMVAYVVVDGVKSNELRWP